MLNYHIRDVFTDRAFAGNPLAIVMEADGLTGAQMQAIATEFNLSETIFVTAPTNPDHDAAVRIFLPRAEIPFAGHPVIGCALHLSGGRDGRIALECQAGLVQVEIADGRAELTAPVLPRLIAGDVDATELAAALALAPEDIGFGTHAPCRAEAGPGFVFAPLRDIAALERARPSGDAFARITAGLGKLYAFAPDGGGFRARMFAPEMGVPEDPATGSATVALAAPLLAAGVLRPGENAFALRQGVEMGRPSDLGLRIDVANGALSRVCVSGRSAPVASGRIAIPPM
ncbi:PhzF family phenazine biosynthesis protein [Paracoccus sp. 1_MG-2023]|uniref:PhzF family phenazine biosynthesis protein n=1 Tax=unclassified Paracoccus (in: a-proteobacteria) TaxID=2688777 RepID=UPI001C08CED2|nr:MULTISPECIES: PhzF family phenazine biosynthesis protein [unclassified Paracoccus (in: a-proteobacteria)]MBU2958130.1 PhzF family phenazine biosynthesis protein [Paracoccus sp. C2R09]MDO6669284.1 PhzF family phenazine biosynthesis protein [Paracoccus sp. 1_MG-2023]